MMQSQNPDINNQERVPDLVPREVVVKKLEAEELQRLREQAQIRPEKESKIAEIKPVSLETPTESITSQDSGLQKSVSTFATPVSQLPVSPEIEFERAQKMDSPFAAVLARNEAQTRYFIEQGIKIEEDTK